jgi:hypothetical protein
MTPARVPKQLVFFRSTVDIHNEQTSQQQPEAARSSQEQPGAAMSSQDQPGPAKEAENEHHARTGAQGHSGAFQKWQTQGSAAAYRRIPKVAISRECAHL